MIGSILGLDHVGLGVRDMERMRSFYEDAFAFDRVLAEMPEEDHVAIHGLLRTPRAVHSAMLLGQERSGPSLALFRATDPVPRPIRKDPRYGDIGVAKLTFAVPDLTAFCRRWGALVGLCSSPKSLAMEGRDGYSFVYGRDPEGNLIEIPAMRRRPARSSMPSASRSPIWSDPLRSTRTSLGLRPRYWRHTLPSQAWSTR